MRKEQNPPLRIRMVDKDGFVTDPLWIRYLQGLNQIYDKVRKPPDVIHTTTATLTTRDYGKVIRFDHGTSEAVCNLMTARLQDVDCWVTVIRTGTGRLTIKPDNASRIEYGSTGGRIWCVEEKRAAANVTLQLISATQWAIIGATGIWNVS